MIQSTSYNLILRAIIFNIALLATLTLYSQTTTIPLYSVFEHEITNKKDYDNNFKDVTLKDQYEAHLLKINFVSIEKRC